MGSMHDKVAIVTGGGRGIGREECLLLAREGAKVVVNDFGGGLDGSGQDERPAAEVARTIIEGGGHALANYDDVGSFDGAKRLIDSTLSKFGRLDSLVNNAGIVRDRMLFNMSEEEFDSVIKVHLKGTFACARWAAAHWREESKKGNDSARHIVNTTSAAGLIGNVGQTNYAAAKAGIAVMTRVWSLELERFGVRVNAIAPAARTRMTEASFGTFEAEKGFDEAAPGNIAPLAVYLASDLSNPLNGEVFAIRGGDLDRFVPWSNPKSISKDSRWTVDEIADRVNELM